MPGQWTSSFADWCRTWVRWPDTRRYRRGAGPPPPPFPPGRGTRPFSRPSPPTPLPSPFLSQTPHVRGSQGCPHPYPPVAARPPPLPFPRNRSSDPPPPIPFPWAPPLPRRTSERGDRGRGVSVVSGSAAVLWGGLHPRKGAGPLSLALARSLTLAPTLSPPPSLSLPPDGAYAGAAGQSNYFFAQEDLHCSRLRRPGRPLAGSGGTPSGSDRDPSRPLTVSTGPS